LTRSALRWPYPAPQALSASADINALTVVANNSRIRSGDAFAIASPSMRAGSILDVTVIVVLPLEMDLDTSLEGCPGGRPHIHGDTLTKTNSYTTLRDVTSRVWTGSGSPSA